jgi:hypothetical protein
MIKMNIIFTFVIEEILNLLSKAFSKEKWDILKKSGLKGTKSNLKYQSVCENGAFFPGVTMLFHWKERIDLRNVWG